MYSKSLWFSLLLGLLLVSTAQAGQWEHAREGWMVGFGLGGGTAEAKVDGNGVDVSSDRSGGGAGSFRVGYAVAPNLVLGLESHAWVRQETETILGTDTDLTTTLSEFTLAATWFPSESGFYLRGGLGGGTISQEVAIGSANVKVEESGFGLIAGIGYEWRLTRTFALGPQLDITYVNIGESDVDDGTGTMVKADVSFNTVTIQMGFNWYF